MDEYTLIRTRSSDEGTEGVFKGVSFTSFTLELPWRNNRPNVSCIPVGDYVCRVVKSPKFGHVFQVLDVPERTHVLHHSGNFAGDRAKGYRTNVLGCILHGKKRGFLYGQRAVLSSRVKIRELYKVTGGQDFKLKIVWG